MREQKQRKLFGILKLMLKQSFITTNKKLINWLENDSSILSSYLTLPFGRFFFQII